MKLNVAKMQCKRGSNVTVETCSESECENGKHGPQDNQELSEMEYKQRI